MCCGRECWVRPGVDHLADTVHRLGHGFRIMARDVFSYRLGVDLTAGFFQALGEPLSLGINLIGNGDRSFHTQSITRHICRRKRQVGWEKVNTVKADAILDFGLEELTDAE